MKDEQMFYITYDPDNDNYIDGMITAKKYNQLPPEQQKQFTQVFVDVPHLYGWGRHWMTARYVNGAVSFPGNWPKDQSVQIQDLAKQLEAAQEKNKAFEDQVQAKIKENANLQQVVLNLQHQVVAVQMANAKGSDK